MIEWNEVKEAERLQNLTTENHYSILEKFEAQEFKKIPYKVGMWILYEVKHRTAEVKYITKLESGGIYDGGKIGIYLYLANVKSSFSHNDEKKHFTPEEQEHIKDITNLMKEISWE